MNTPPNLHTVETGTTMVYDGPWPTRIATSSSGRRACSAGRRGRRGRWKSRLPSRRLPFGLVVLLAVVSVLGAQESGGADGNDDEFSGGFGVERDDGGDSGGGFDGGFSAEGDGAGSSSDESAPSGDGFGSFGSFGGDTAQSDPLRWGGRLRFDARALADYDEPESSPVDAGAEAQVELNYTGPDSEALIRLEVDEGLGSNENEDAAGDELLRTLMDEAYIHLFYDRFDLQAGYIKSVWGQGDQVHVVDFLNSNDYTDFINPDYIERRLAAGMLKVNVPWSTQGGRSGRIELAYLPVLRPDHLPESGPWAPEQAVILEELLTGYAGALTEWRAPQSGAPAPPAAGVPAPETQLWAGATAQDAVIFESTRSLQFGQVGTRATARLGGVDLGAVYYWGYLKTPTPRIRLADPVNSGSVDPDGTITLEYNRLHGFGLEGATVLGPFNVRAEAAYYLTEDVDGDDPEVPNNSIEYLLGFDVDLGVSSLNLNVQGTGSYILESDAIDDAGLIAGSSGTGDISELYGNPAARLNYQYDPDGIYTSHIVSAALTDSWRNDRIRPEVSVAMNVERQDWRVSPAVEFVLRDDTLFEVSSSIFGGDDSGVFGQYDENDYLQLRFEYNF